MSDGSSKPDPNLCTPDDQGWMWVLFQLPGRIPRTVFWAGTIFVWVLLLLSVGITYALGLDGSRGPANLIASLAFFVVYIVTFWMSVALQIKRWHDRGKSGWWYFIFWIPVIGWVWALVELGFLAGTPGSNRYGENPAAEAPTDDLIGPR